MNAQRAARWSGSGICNGRLRLGFPTARNYSVLSAKTSLRAATGARRAQNASHTFRIQQTRSISIFGWGGSSKPDDFAKAHAAQDNATTGSASLEHIRSVKASHATADTPDPQVSISTELPHTPEPGALKHLENIVADPGGHAPELSKTISQVAEYKGYLKEICGLDYGWGPTATLENVLETLHITGGLSWTASIVGVAIFYRVITAIFVYRSADQGVRLKQVMPILQPIKDQMQEATLKGDINRRQQLAAEIQAINKDIGFNAVRMFMPLLVQIPLGFGGFRLLRGCATAPVPAFETESWLWNVDLTMSDPYYALPLLQGLLLFWTVRMSQKAGIQALSGGMGTFLTVGLPTISVVWSTFQPGSVQLFFLTSTALASVQSYALSKNGFRRMIGLLEMPPTNPSQTGAGAARPRTTSGLRRMDDLPGAGKVIDVKPRTPSSPPSSPSTDGTSPSFVDKLVDSAKAKTQQLKGGLWNQTKEEAAEKMKKRQREAELEKAQKHEYKRKEQLQHERDSRNRVLQNRSQAPEGTTQGPGGMRVMKERERSRR